MALPNLWGLYNLRSSPFFQATLRADSEATPLRLFVGRQLERQLLLTTIGSSPSSRQAVAGRPGIGKTTLVQTVKADAQAEGYWSSNEIIPISAEGASEQLLGLLLSSVYDAVLANRPTATLQQLIEAGAVEPLPRRGREAIQYLTTGTARLPLPGWRCSGKERTSILRRKPGDRRRHILQPEVVHHDAVAEVELDAFLSQGSRLSNQLSTALPVSVGAQKPAGRDSDSGRN
jgi:hypothetical protein